MEMIEMRLTPNPFKQETIVTYVRTSLSNGTLEKDIKETCDVMKYLEGVDFKKRYPEYNREQRQSVIAKFTVLLKSLLKAKEYYAQPYIESKTSEDICRPNMT
jgi:hypothetical protein